MKRRDGGKELSSSFTDLMTSVAILFLFLAVAMIVVSVLREKIEQSNTHFKRQRLFEELVIKLGQNKMNPESCRWAPSPCSRVFIDQGDIRVVFLKSTDGNSGGTCNGLNFGSGKHRIDTVAEKVISEQLVTVIHSAEKEGSGVVTIRLEGHTDKQLVGPSMTKKSDVFDRCLKFEAGADCDAKNNLLLSSMRASAVYSRLKEALKTSRPQISHGRVNLEPRPPPTYWFESATIVSGRGQIVPFLDPCATDASRSTEKDRRVELVLKVGRD